MILDKIVAAKQQRIAQAKKSISVDEMVRLMPKHLPDTTFRGALEKSGISIIAEAKKASPSKGIICEDFDPVSIAQQYEQSGAAAISVLTEQDFFLGNDGYLRNVAQAVAIPVLRKDFIVDEWQVYQSRMMGANAILLITAILSAGQLEEYREMAMQLGMDALVEVHNESELDKALASGAHIVGINNRNLQTFDVTLETTQRLIDKIPDDKVIVSESGIATRDDMVFLEGLGVDAVLIGETLMRADDISAKLKALKGDGA